MIGPIVEPTQKTHVAIMGSRVAIKNHKNYEGRTVLYGNRTEYRLCEELASHIHGTFVQLTQMHDGIMDP